MAPLCYRVWMRDGRSITCLVLTACEARDAAVRLAIKDAARRDLSAREWRNACTVARVEEADYAP